MSGTAECGPCGLVFVSDGSFDAHRVGVDEYTYSEGLKMEPPREDGRRCLTLREMQDLAWTQNQYDRWRAPDEEREQILDRVEL